MRAISAENYAALQERRLVARDFLSIKARDRDTGAAAWDHQWSDVGEITINVIDPDTGGTSSRTFYGSGTLTQVSDVALVSNLTVQNVTITMSQVNDRVEELVRGYDCKQATVQLFRGLFDPVTRALVAPAVPRFVGYVDSIVITTPTEGESGGVVLTCASSTQEMTRSNPDTRSHQSQILRAAGDTFYKDSAVVSNWVMFWGKNSEPVQTAVGTVPYSGMNK